MKIVLGIVFSLSSIALVGMESKLPAFKELVTANDPQAVHALGLGIHVNQIVKNHAQIWEKDFLQLDPSSKINIGSMVLQTTQDPKITFDRLEKMNNSDQSLKSLKEVFDKFSDYSTILFSNQSENSFALEESAKKTAALIFYRSIFPELKDNKVVLGSYKDKNFPEPDTLAPKLN